MLDIPPLIRDYPGCRTPEKGDTVATGLFDGFGNEGVEHAVYDEGDQWEVTYGPDEKIIVITENGSIHFSNMEGDMRLVMNTSVDIESLKQLTGMVGTIFVKYQYF